MRKAKAADFAGVRGQLHGKLRVELPGKVWLPGNFALAGLLAELFPGS